MTWDSVFWSIVLSIVSSFVFWIMSFVYSSTKVIFADVIEKSMIESYGDGDALYMIRMMNIGRRDLIEINYSAKILIDLEYMGRTTSQTCYFSLENDLTRPEMKGRGKKAGKRYYRASICRFAMNDSARAEFLKPYYSDTIRKEARENTLSLDDLFREYGDKVRITIYAAGTDRVTGSRRLFSSRKFTSDNIRLGKYKPWYAGMKRIPRHTLRRKALMSRAISQFEPVDEFITDTNIDPLEVLKNTNSEAKSGFLADSGREKPDNIYGKIDISEIRRKKGKLEEALDFIDKVGVSRADMAPYISLMNYNLRKLRLVESCYDWPRAESDGEKARIARMHREANDALYGSPDPEMYRSVIAAVSGEESSFAFYQPPEGIRTRFEKKLASHLKEILSVIPEKQSYTFDEVCSIMNLALAKVPNAVSLGWKAIVSRDAAFASVDPRTRIVNVPGSRTSGPYTYDSIRSTVAHEIGTHVFRFAALESCSCSALREGLPGYDSFEEGLATIVEQSVSGQRVHPGIRHYVCVGLASLDGLNFRETYEKLLDTFGRDHLSEGLAFDSVQRAFRGTGELVCTKDLAYYNGYDRAWKYIEEHIDDENLMDILFRSGKTDPTNEEHMSILKQCRQESLSA